MLSIWSYQDDSRSCAQVAMGHARLQRGRWIEHVYFLSNQWTRQSLVSLTKVNAFL